MHTTLDRKGAASTRTNKEIPPLSERDAQLVNVARRCLLKALDHSRAEHIILKSDKPGDGSVELKLPPAALRVMARVLTLMGERKPLFLMPRDHELTTQEVANMLGVSRPFVVKAIKEEKLSCRMVGSHRRVPYEEAARFRDQLRSAQDAALQALADEAQEQGLGYK